MARRGILQLQKLTFRYCEFGGSSRGAREYIETMLPAFKEKYPNVEIETKTKTDHPVVFAEYRNGKMRPVDVKNKHPEQIDFFVSYLQSSIGNKTRKPLDTRHVTNRPSIQGKWSALDRA
mmetsp:Transcript_61555/g.194823  ORF Transcript_61555/g.194823 Transcript_61555/m.194823 type:complete len:120 (-) Transcript_61555:20-379(-)